MQTTINADAALRTKSFYTYDGTALDLYLKMDWNPSPLDLRQLEVFARASSFRRAALGNPNKITIFRDMLKCIFLGCLSSREIIHYNLGIQQRPVAVSDQKSDRIWRKESVCSKLDITISLSFCEYPSTLPSSLLIIPPGLSYLKASRARQEHGRPDSMDNSRATPSQQADIPKPESSAETAPNPAPVSGGHGSDGNSAPIQMWLSNPEAPWSEYNLTNDQNAGTGNEEPGS